MRNEKKKNNFHSSRFKNKENVKRKSEWRGKTTLNDENDYVPHHRR